MWVREGWEAILPYLPTTNEARELSDMTVWQPDAWRETEYSRTDLDGCLETCTRAFDQSQPVTMEYRLRRHKEEYGSIGNTGTLRSSADSSAAGYIGCAAMSGARADIPDPFPSQGH